MPQPEDAPLRRPGLAQGADGDLLRLEIATYVGQMCVELSAMAKASEMNLLSYFLDMGAAEARDAASRLNAALFHDPEPPDVPDQTLT